MKSSWKHSLYECMRKVNELEIEKTAHSLAGIVNDDNYLRLLQKRIAAAKDGDRTRGIERLTNEMRLKTYDVKMLSKRTQVYCRAKRKLSMRQAGKTWTEERLEKYRLIMTRAKGRWMIDSVDLLDDEATAVQSANHEAVKRPSLPYLHPSLNPSRERRKIRYDREAVRQYADSWWDDPNPDYLHFQVDCTNFVSQCLYAGGVPMDYTGKRDRGWWYRKQNGREAWSFSWSVAHSLYWYLADPRSVFRAESVESPQLLDIGDVILYDWNGSGRYGHSTIVTARDADGMPLVNAHTSNSKRRYWDYRDSTAWTEKTRYRFFHIADWL